MKDLTHPADCLVEAMARIYHYRMTTTSGGNLSIRDADGSIWITPARVDKGALRNEDIVRVLPDQSIEGRHKPSSEFPSHKKIYTARLDLRATSCMPHPVTLVAFSICGQTPNTRLFTKAHALCCARRRLCAVSPLPGSERLGDRIANVFAAGHNCVMLENHGVVVGESLIFRRRSGGLRSLEFVAKTSS